MQHLVVGLLFAAVMVLPGCAGDSAVQRGAAAELQATGILEGKVTIGPICPVEGPGMDCDPDPSLYTSHHLLVHRNGAVVKEVALDGQGNFRTELVAGAYIVDFTPHDIGFPGSFTPPEVVIEAGKTTTIVIEVDTGIR